MIRQLKKASPIILGLLLAPSLPQALALRVVSEVKDASPIWQWVATVLIVAVCALVIFKNAKRSHQT